MGDGNPPPETNHLVQLLQSLSQLLNLTAETVRYQKLEKPEYLIERERKTLEPLGINKREEMWNVIHSLFRLPFLFIYLYFF